MSDNNINLVEDDLSGRFLTFYIDDNIYGIELLHVIEIISVQSITKVPYLPAYFKGIINLRGKIVPVIDVRLKLTLPEKEYDDKTCIIVIMIEDTNVGLIVDSVSEVSTISQEQTSLPPELKGNHANRYLQSISKVGDRIILNLDCQKFLRDTLAATAY